MAFESFKENVLKKRSGKILLLIISIAILFFYFKAFNTTGVEFEDCFLKKEVVGSERHYVGSSTYGKMLITVKGDINEQRNINVIFDLPSDIYKEYTVNFKEEPIRSSDIEIVDQDGNLVFEGEYKRGTSFLYDKKGELFINDHLVQIRFGGRSPFNEDYQLSFKNVVSFAIGSNETIRGNYEFIVIAIILFAITLFDIKFPLFFFYLRNFLDVKDPEPSDFYLAMQRISWYVMPIIGIILMLVAIS